MFVFAIIILVLTSSYRMNPTTGKQMALRILSCFNLFFVFATILTVVLPVIVALISDFASLVTDHDISSVIIGFSTIGVGTIINIIISIIASSRALKAIKEITPTTNTFTQTYTDIKNRYTATFNQTTYTAPMTVVQVEKPEWKCGYCGRMNKGDDPDCDGCGAPRAS
ncbi:MAG: hypothetical protein J1E39_01325 [Eubacterium sp.]|nr:hypothetical protein [Eubacterium sp.]